MLDPVADGMSNRQMAAQLGIVQGASRTIAPTPLSSRGTGGNGPRIAGRAKACPADGMRVPETGVALTFARARCRSPRICTCTGPRRPSGRGHGACPC
ncbi:MAG: hypothetical protein ACPMAQ_06435 [Phycisphaerae bacterium]